MAADDDKGNPRLPVASVATGAAGWDDAVGEDPAIRPRTNRARIAVKAASFSRGTP